MGWYKEICPLCSHQHNMHGVLCFPCRRLAEGEEDELCPPSLWGWISVHSYFVLDSWPVVWIKRSRLGVNSWFHFVSGKWMFLGSPRSKGSKSDINVFNSCACYDYVNSWACDNSVSFGGFWRKLFCCRLVTWLIPGHYIRPNWKSQSGKKMLRYNS